MEEFVRGVVQAMVGYPEEVCVKEIEGSNTRIFEIKVSILDVGRVLGKKGQNIKALRNIFAAADKGRRHHIIINVIT